jgi:FtsH-binding integral membrane protein
MRSRAQMLPVWFFVGVLLVAYGAVIVVTGVCEWSQPPATVLSQYHPAFWGGLILLGLGGFYTIRFWPGKR